MSEQKTSITQTSGSFTPDVQFGGATTGITYSSRSGSYVKTGNVVNYSCAINLSSKGSANGDLTIAGLPFTNGPNIGQATVVASFLRLGASYDTFKGQVNASAATISIFQEGDNVAALLVDDADFNNTTSINISGAYFLA
jgi:hypothetical protein